MEDWTVTVLLKTQKSVNGELIETVLSTFKADKRDATGFDMDLLSLDRVYRHIGTGQVTYASRDWGIRASWLTRRLQRWFGVNE